MATPRHEETFYPVKYIRQSAEAFRRSLAGGRRSVSVPAEDREKAKQARWAAARKAEQKKKANATTPQTRANAKKTAGRSTTVATPRTRAKARMVGKVAAKKKRY